MRAYSSYRTRPKILIVEDEPIIQRIHKSYLEKIDCDAEMTADSSDALLLSQQHYDLILLDIGLPHLNGIAVAGEIRKREQMNNQNPTPIIAITIYPLSEIETACINAGINEIAPKPVSFNEFQKLILRWLPTTAITAC